MADEAKKTGTGSILGPFRVPDDSSGGSVIVGHGNTSVKLVLKNVDGVPVFVDPNFEVKEHPESHVSWWQFWRKSSTS